MPVPLRHRFWRWFYNRVAFAYDPVLRLGERLHIGSEEHMRGELFTLVKLPLGAVVADVGCGTGSLIPHVPAGSCYIGIDSSLNMLREARRKQVGNAAFILADAIALPLARNSVHFAVAVGVLQHTTDPAAARIQLHRIAASYAIADEHHAYDRISAAAPGAQAGRQYKDYFVLFFDK